MYQYIKSAATYCSCLLFVLLGITWFAVPAHAAVDGAASSNLYLEDGNNNGKIDRIAVSIANTSGDTWEINGALPNGISVTQSGQAITVSSIAFTTATNAATIGIIIGLSEADGDLLVSSDGVNEAAIELIYTQVGGGAGCTNCIKDSDEELNAIATGDTGATDTEVDNADPIVTAVAVTTNTISGITYNALQITYTENIKISTDAGGDNDIAQGASGTSSATAGGMADTAKVISGFGQYDGSSDCRQNLNTTNTIASVDSSLNTIVTISFNTTASSTAIWDICGTGPSTDGFTPVADANDIRDFSSLNNPVSAAVKVMTVSNAWDVTAPTIANTYSCDSDNDGDVNRFQINFSESILDAGTAVDGFEGDNDTTNDGSGEETASSTNTATGGCDGNADDADANDEKMRLDLSTGISGTETAYVNAVGSPTARDWAGNRLAAGSGLGTENDKARPVLTSHTPASASINASTSQVITLTFSESVASLTAATSPSVTFVTTGVPGATATMTPSSVYTNNTTHTLTISGAPDSSGNTFYGAQSGGTAVHPFSFVTIARSNSSSGSVTTVANTLTVTGPEAGESYEPGDDVPITWETTGTGISYVDITVNVETATGTTTETIVQDTLNDGEYVWTAPNVISDNVTVIVTGTDLADDIDSDTSEVFAIIADEATDDENVAEESDEMGVSPVTGLPEALSIVTAEQYIKGSSFNTVYYIDAEMVRHPFMDSQTWFTYEDDFDAVVTVTDATLTSLTLGTPVLPKAGVVLVKLESLAKVYAVVTNEEGDTELRWITSESLATELYGNDWAEYVIDVSDTLWPRFAKGDDVDSSSDIGVNTSMKKRAELH